MGQFTGTTFGVGIPTVSPLTQSLAGPMPYAGQALGVQAVPQQLYGQTLSSPLIGGGIGPYGLGTSAWSPLQQITQLLQIVPQQLQQVQLLQQQQLLHLQQLLQWVPAQLQQLQQLIQVLPHQVQQLQQQAQPAISAPLAFGVIPQPFTGQASHVM